MPLVARVETKTFRLHTGIAGIFHRLGVNYDQRRPARFFLPVHALVHVRHSSVPRIPQRLATVCSANRRWNKGGGLWVSLTNLGG